MAQLGKAKLEETARLVSVSRLSDSSVATAGGIGPIDGRDVDTFDECSTFANTLRDSDFPEFGPDTKEKVVKTVKLISYLILSTKLFDSLIMALYQYTEGTWFSFIHVLFKKIQTFLNSFSLSSWILAAWDFFFHNPIVLAISAIASLVFTIWHDRLAKRPKYQRQERVGAPPLRIRFVRPHGSPIRFTFGSRGFSIVGPDRLAFHVLWNRIESIYLDDEVRSLGFDEIHPYSAEKKPRKVVKHPEFFSLPASHREYAIPKSGVRVRLVRDAGNTDGIEEILIPDRFFRHNGTTLDRKKFVQKAWEFKWRYGHDHDLIVKSSK